MTIYRVSPVLINKTQYLHYFYTASDAVYTTFTPCLHYFYTMFILLLYLDTFLKIIYIKFI